MPHPTPPRRWELLDQRGDVEIELERELGTSALVARVLAARGICDVEAARSFLTPSLDRDWADPHEIPGMAEAADRVEAALKGHETIAIFGDFDVDGMSSTCLLTLGLRELGGAVMPYIPHRFGEGYGLSEEALNRVIADCDPDLVITVDNGIAAAAEVAWLRSQGIDAVITDHHEPGDLVPAEVPVTDPKLSAACASRELAGAGVALKLVDELGRRMGKPGLWRRYTDIATLGTLSDMMLLTPENRALVAEGIERMRATTRPGLVALAATAGVDLAAITADSLPFSIIPRLNAAGRMGTSDIAFDLLLTDDPAEAAVLAGKLEEINSKRREIESILSDEALAKVEEGYAGGRVVVVGGAGWHEGVKGIVASRIVNRYHVPALLFTISDGIARGSGRSVGSVDLFHAVEQCSDMLIRFGGHPGAVGVTVEEGRLDEFRQRLENVLSKLPAEQFIDTGEVTATVSLDELTVESIGSLECLQPFGQGNKRPLFAACGVGMSNRSCVGLAGTHLRFMATDGAASVPAIMFRAPDVDRLAAYDGECDIVFDAVNETWQGRTKAKLMVRDILIRADGVRLQTGRAEGSISDELFDKAAEILARDEYASIADAERFVTKVVGVSFEGRQQKVAGLSEGSELAVVRQPDNPYDPHAMAIMTSAGDQVGFLRRQIARALAPLADAGVRYRARVLQVTGGDQRSWGVNIEVARVEDTGARGGDETGARPERARLSALPAAELIDELRRRMIGSNRLLPAQAKTLGLLGDRRSSLCIMATGRGKSLIFHLHAARTALLENRASVFVYPLRALVADQSFHLAGSFGEIGMKVVVLTGETPLDERAAIFSELAAGDADIVLTTPEFLAIHKARFAEAGRVGFVVIDEAHHAGLSKSGNRSAYASLPEVRAALGEPTVLAVTATAEDAVAQEICRLAGIDADSVVVDRSIRDNLRIIDHRNAKDRESELVSVVSRGAKCIVYVNSREQSISLARMLRRKIPELGRSISFYNAGLTRSERTRVERAFRSDELSCIVSTSAFGEGVNLPDIAHVMLYHMPFGRIEFNQMSGRAGRNGEDAEVHILFGSKDTKINERIIASSAPTRGELSLLYRALMTLSHRAASSTGEAGFSESNAAIADLARSIDPKTPIDERSVSCGISIFRELGFLATTGFGTARRIEMVESPVRMDLGSSIRYLEGLRSREEFGAFSTWVLTASADEMLAQINRPITPTFGIGV